MIARTVPAALLAFLLVAPAHAEEAESTLRMRRQVYGTAVPVSVGNVIPVKMGAQLGMNVDRDFTLEAELQKGGVGGLRRDGLDFDGVDEQLVMVNGRIFSRTDSFNLILGAGERRYRLTISPDRLDQIAPGRDLTAVDADGDPVDYHRIQVSTFVAQMGVGNRWALDSGLTVGVDWLTVYLPVGRGLVTSAVDESIQEPEDRKRMNHALAKLRDTPSVSALKMNVGWAF